MNAVTVGNLEIAYREWGSGDPILFINGTGESSQSWTWQGETLGERWRCVAIDNRDTGASTYVDDAYAPADLAGDAAGVIESLGLGPCHVVGYSLGGAAAQELAIARPELVRSLVLVCTWAASDIWFVATMKNWQSVRHAHWDDEPAFLEALAPWLFSPITFAHPDTLRRIEEMWEQEDNPQKPEGWMRQTEADIAHDASARLAQIVAPALVVSGEDDICTPARYTRALFHLLSVGEMATIPDAGHCAPFEQPAAVNTVLDRFLSRH